MDHVQIVNNCGVSAASSQATVLAEAGRQLYEFERVTLTQGGTLMAARPSSGTTDRAAVVIKQLQGDRTGRVFAVDNTDVTILGYALQLFRCTLAA